MHSIPEPRVQAQQEISPAVELASDRQSVSASEPAPELEPQPALPPLPARSMSCLGRVRVRSAAGKASALAAQRAGLARRPKPRTSAGWLVTAPFPPPALASASVDGAPVAPWHQQPGESEDVHAAFAIWALSSPRP